LEYGGKEPALMNGLRHGHSKSPLRKRIKIIISKKSSSFQDLSDFMKRIPVVPIVGAESTSNACDVGIYTAMIWKREYVPGVRGATLKERLISIPAEAEKK
jgi:hypothetical protein